MISELSPKNTGLKYGRAVYFLFYAGAACLTPFLTLHYEALGLSGTQIGTLAALVPLITLISAPLWGGLSDATGRHRMSLLAAIGGAWIVVLLMARVITFSGLLPAVAFFAFFTAPIMPLVDNSVMELLAEKRNEYGRIRVWGALGWGGAALVIGSLLHRAGLGWMFYGYLFFMVLTFIAAVGLPVAAPERSRLSFRKNLGGLLGNGQFLALLLATLAFGFSLSVILSYLFLYMGRLGATTTMMSWTLTISTIGEVPFWFISDRLFGRFGRTSMISLALALTTVRLLIYGIMPSAWWALPTSLLHGPTFAIMWAAGVAEADAAAPPGLGATAQGLVSAAMFGLGAALGAFFGGIGYDAVGPQRLFQLTALLVVVALVVFVLSRNRTGKAHDRVAA